MNLVEEFNLLEAVGSRLRDARLLKNQTQAQVADRVGVGERVIRKLEAGENVGLDTFLAVCDHLGYKTDLLTVLGRDKPSTIEEHQAMRFGRLARRRRAR